jgi:hypothetical protein
MTVAYEIVGGDTLGKDVTLSGRPDLAPEKSLFTLSIEGSLRCLAHIAHPPLAPYTPYAWAIELPYRWTVGSCDDTETTSREG